MDFGSWDWGTIIARLAAIGTFLAGIFAWLSRKGFADLIASRVVVAHRIRSLSEHNVELSRQLTDAQHDFDFAARASTFTRAEAETLIARITVLEKGLYDTERQLSASLEYIKLLLAHIQFIGNLLQPNTAPQTPEMPSSLLAYLKTSNG